MDHTIWKVNKNQYHGILQTYKLCCLFNTCGKMGKGYNVDWITWVLIGWKVICQPQLWCMKYRLRGNTQNYMRLCHFPFSLPVNNNTIYKNKPRLLWMVSITSKKNDFHNQISVSHVKSYF